MLFEHQSGAMNDEPVIELADVSFSHDGTPVLEKANLSVLRRDFVSIVGPNGGGKTTLLKLLLGLLRPSEGSIRVLGESPAQARHRVGYMPQYAHVDPQFPVNVMDVVLMGRLGHTGAFGPYRGVDREAALGALEEMKISQLGRRAFSALSGGQRQRVLIARALACEPELLLLDEPTASLDQAIESELYELLYRLAERLTVLVVSHDLGFVSQFVNRVVCVKRNVVVHPTSEVTGEVISEVYGSPMKIVRHDHETAEAFNKCISS